MTAHAFLPPSGASTWQECAMWATMNQRYPEFTGDIEASEEGTAAHWVMSEMLAGRNWPKGTQTPNNQIVTDEMIEGAELVAYVVDNRMSGLTLHIEETIPIPSIHLSTFGTPDVWASTGVSRKIEIVDYKFGHRFVSEYFNPQGLCYLAGICELMWGGKNKMPADVTVSFTVVQPRCYYKGSPVRTHTFSIKSVVPYMQRLRNMAMLATLPDPVATTNKGCCYCPGRHSCSALQRAAYSDAEFATDRTPLELSPVALGTELRMLERAHDRLGARVDALREQALATIRGGTPVAGYHIEQGRGRLQWTLPEDQMIAIGNMFGVDITKRTLITPTQAKKLIDESVITAYSQSNPTAAKLVADNLDDVRKTFGA